MFFTDLTTWYTTETFHTNHKCVIVIHNKREL